MVFSPANRKTEMAFNGHLIKALGLEGREVMNIDLSTAVDSAVMVTVKFLASDADLRRMMGDTGKSG